MSDTSMQSAPRTPQQEFDDGCATFTHRLNFAAGWKQNYYGAAYATRLKQAIREARDACDTMEVVLKQDAAVTKE